MGGCGGDLEAACTVLVSELMDFHQRSATRYSNLLSAGDSTHQHNSYKLTVLSSGWNSSVSMSSKVTAWLLHGVHSCQPNSTVGSAWFSLTRSSHLSLQGLGDSCEGDWSIPSSPPALEQLWRSRCCMRLACDCADWPALSSPPLAAELPVLHISQKQNGMQSCVPGLCHCADIFRVHPATVFHYG